MNTIELTYIVIAEGDGKSMVTAQLPGSAPGSAPWLSSLAQLLGSTTCSATWRLVRHKGAGGSGVVHTQCVCVCVCVCVCTQYTIRSESKPFSRNYGVD